jgi:hypothetical protein
LNQLPKLRNAEWHTLWSLWFTKQRECGKLWLWPVLKCLYLVTLSSKNKPVSHLTHGNWTKVRKAVNTVSVDCVL